MNMTRRLFVTSSVMATGLRIVPAFASQASDDAVTSGGIGLTLADIQGMYEELPVGQSFRNFREPDTGTALYIDFGAGDLAQTIYVSGDLVEDDVADLISWLVLDDVQDQRAFTTLTSAGSIAEFHAITMTSPSLAEYTNDRTSILATWRIEPADSSDRTATGLIITLQREGVG